MTKAISLLLIDDNPDDIEFYSDLLSRCKTNYTLVTAETAQEGLELLENNEIDCCLLDYNIPDKDGIQILDTIRGGKSSGIPIIILTGVPDQTVKAQAARKGAMNYLEKDINMEPADMDKVILEVLEWARVKGKKV